METAEHQLGDNDDDNLVIAESTMSSDDQDSAMKRKTDDAKISEEKTNLKRKAEEDINVQEEKVPKIEDFQLNNESGERDATTSEISETTSREDPENIQKMPSPKQRTIKSPQNSSQSAPPVEATRQSVRANRNSNPAAILMKKPKLPTDMSNPAYRKPFKFGWRRELVYRANSESGTKRNGDIYYFTPDGKKVRSMREVLENLKNKELSTENFTFYKEPVGMNNPELEIIRMAKVKGSAGPTGGFVAKKVPKKELKLIEKPLLSLNPSKSTKSPKFGSALKIKLSGARLSQNKRQLSSSKSDKKRKSTSKPSLQMGMLPPGWQSSPKKKSDNFKLSNSSAGSSEKMKQLAEQCSIRCSGVNPVVPTLQCSLCVCLYHPECVGLPQTNQSTPPDNYVCKNCQPEDPNPQLSENDMTMSNSDPANLPTLTPFSALKTHSPVSTIPPRLHRINSADNSSHRKLLLNRNKTGDSTPSNSENIATQAADTNSKSLVGSVTTWVHPSSTVIQNNESSLIATESSQSQATIGGRKFIIIPKQNVLSIHPNEQTNLVPSESAQIPSAHHADSETLSTSLDKMPDTASLGPVTYNSEVITITTNNASYHNSSEHFLGDSPAKNRDSKLNTPKGTPEKLNMRNKRNSQRNSTTSTTSTLSEKPVKFDNRQKEQYMQNFFTHVSFGYNALLHIFQYLKVQELLRASRVCRMWNNLASHPSLWRIVRMKNSQVRDWRGLVLSLKRYGTRTLDLRKMLLPTNSDEMWQEFSNELHNADNLTRIDLCRCPASVVENLAKSNPRLEVINAVSIRCTSIDLSAYDQLRNLRELRLKSQSGIDLKADFTFLEQLQNLKHLSLLSFKDLGKKNIEVVGKLSQLETLELGECDALAETFSTDVLSKLTKIERMRLEKGPSGASTYNILQEIAGLKHLEQIELVNFDVKPGFDQALAGCTNIKRFLLIPTYISQSATTNNMVLNGIFQLSNNLTHFVWGVTLELLRVTELFIDQCDQTPKKKTLNKKDKKVMNNDSIPILKPVPFLEDSIKPSDSGKSEDGKDVQDNTQVEILSLQTLQNLLSTKLEKTKVKILKIPYHATWRQSINETIQ